MAQADTQGKRILRTKAARFSGDDYIVNVDKNSILDNIFNKKISSYIKKDYTTPEVEEIKPAEPIQEAATDIPKIISSNEQDTQGEKPEIKMVEIPVVEEKQPFFKSVQSKLNAIYN